MFSFVAASLYSQNDRTRDEGADGLLKLANKCADVGSMEVLLKHLFNVFNGSEGKLSLASQKISVLQVRLAIFSSGTACLVLFCFNDLGVP